MNRLESYLDQVRTLAALSSQREARHAAGAVLRALVRVLPATERLGLQALLDELRALDDADAAQGPAEAVARALGVDAERASEVTERVTVATLEALGSQAATVLTQLPEALRPKAALEVPHVPRAAHAGPPEDHTLAGGRPGSRHPLVDADASRAQRHSVVASTDPHADSRLASAHELVPEGQTLAEGKPGSKRPVSG